MTGTFEIETKTSEWFPPFTKTNTLNAFVVKTGDKFDLDDKIKENVFEVVSVGSQSAVVKFNRQYSVKKGQYAVHEDVVAAQTLRLTTGNTVELSYMWGNTGRTKKITYTGVCNGNDTTNVSEELLEKSQGQSDSPEQN